MRNSATEAPTNNTRPEAWISPRRSGLDGETPFTLWDLVNGDPTISSI